MLEQTVAFFESWFIYPGLPWNLLLIGIVLALVFGAIWLAAYRPPLLKEPWLWAVLAGSAFFSLIAVSFVQIPLQYWAGQALEHLSLGVINFLLIFDIPGVTIWLLLAGIPQVLLSGLVQEGAKMVPVVVWWQCRGRNIDPRLGLLIGAVAGAGLGVFEAVWVNNQIFASGWTWQVVQAGGLVALVGFWERFVTVAFHIAVSALAGYGLAKGRGWQFYLIAAGLHALLNYSAVLYRSGVFNITYVETYAVVITGLVTAAVLWLRWRKIAEPPAGPEAETEDELVIGHEA